MANILSITRRHALKVFPALATLPAAAAIAKMPSQDPMDTLVHRLQMVAGAMNETGTRPIVALSGIEEIEARWPAGAEGDFEASEDFQRWEKLVARQQSF